jgi:uncharacterized membrane protein
VSISAERQLAAEQQGMADVIAGLLIVGVVTSAVLMAAGLLLLAVTGRSGYPGELGLDALVNRTSEAFPRTIGDIVSGVRDLRPFALIELGVIVLIATPVVRVAASVLLFWHERDRLYAGITLIVLALLLVSIFWLQ